MQGDLADAVVLHDERLNSGKVFGVSDGEDNKVVPRELHMCHLGKAAIQVLLERGGEGGGEGGEKGGRRGGRRGELEKSSSSIRAALTDRRTDRLTGSSVSMFPSKLSSSNWVHSLTLSGRTVSLLYLQRGGAGGGGGALSQCLH